MAEEKSIRDVLADFRKDDPEGFEVLWPHVEFPERPPLEPVPETEEPARDS
jgi:hypothetical protein